MNCFLARQPNPPKKSHVVKFGLVDGQFVGDNSKAMSPPTEVKDDYFWMRDDEREDKSVLKHLNKENRYTASRTRKLKPLASKIYKELLDATCLTDQSVSIELDKYMYYTRTEKGKSYKIHCRKAICSNQDAPEQIILNENILARRKKYCNVGSIAVSPCENVLAFSVDYNGSESYTINFINLETGQYLTDDTIENTTGSVVWGSDRTSVYYCTMDEAFRPHMIWYHRLVTNIASSGEASIEILRSGNDDVCLFEEKDPKFNVSIWKSRSSRFLFCSSASSTSSEQRFLDLERETEEIGESDLKLISARKDDIIYKAFHSKENEFLICTNADGAVNFNVVKANIGESESCWTSLFEYDECRSILNIYCFETFSIMSGREKGLPALWLLPRHRAEHMYKLDAFESVADIQFAENEKYKSNKFRFIFSSLLTPHQTWEYDACTHERVLLKQYSVPSYDRTEYDCERIYASGNDGTRIPITLIWKKTATRAGNKPNFLHLYGYGSYQVPIDSHFRKEILPLVNRGIVYAIAHVRGGGEFGREWYESATFENKKITFDDFLCCAEYLIETRRTAEQMISVEGESAGGMLVGAVLNSKPHLFRACIAGVPFVDVLNTMSDPSIPLTTGEWLEWGNPHQRKYFESINEYCPYQNIRLNPYPAILATAGLHDNRVLYSEAAKWVTKLRNHTTSQRDILLKVNMNAGHFSASSRYYNLKERAFELAWLVSELGVKYETK